MATHTNSGGGNYGRKFQIGRENGQQNKDGTPYFMEWVQSIPENTQGRKFETRTGADGKQRFFELFRALDGYLVGITTEEKVIQNNPSVWLVLHISDMGEDYRIEVGEISGRYSMDILKRLLDPNFNPMEKVRLSPYSLKDGDRVNIGLSAINGTDTKLSAARYDPGNASRAHNSNLEGIPQATSREWKGKTEWDFSPISDWLISQVKSKVLPRLVADPISFKNEAIDYPEVSQDTPAQTGFDDLPF